jgi:DNA-3-methyladenine glycosylase I
MSAVIRCSWAQTRLGIAYHDKEWGVPVHDDRRFFEFLIFEGAQAGLSWETILRKREAYRDAFAGFDPARVARLTPARIERTLQNPGIVRNRLKVESTVQNAKAFLAVQRECGTFDAYFVAICRRFAACESPPKSERSPAPYARIGCIEPRSLKTWI